MDNESNKITSNSELERKVISHEPLLENLDLELSPELVEIISALKVALLSPELDSDSLKQLWTEYAQRFEAFAEQSDIPEAYTKAQIGASVHKALLFREAGMELRYLEELNMTEIYTANVGFNQLSVMISDEINTKITELESSPERLILQLRGKINDDNQMYLWELWADEQDYEDLINHAYEMLLGEGEDPEEILGELGALES